LVADLQGVGPQIIDLDAQWVPSDILDDNSSTNQEFFRLWTRK
jgi:hypothetical protein